MAGIAEKFTSLMARPNEDPNDAAAPWYIKYGARVIGIIGAFFCILFGLYNCISILFANVSCLVSGILQIILGFLVMGVEAPFCCMFIDYVQVVSSKVDSRPLWNRAAAYCALACVPVFICPGLASIFACGLVFGCGVLYGMIGLGKKASREEMAQRANTQQQAPNGAPGFDSNV
ncbi:calcium channel flower-like isoform X2 [Culicoides brevitarsis]|uniref:calcium channel flower-like isoform X2 n=1 Tax=Culicoides brevitarsis TaxID=469753 RepID=UPI00307C8749